MVQYGSFQADRADGVAPEDTWAEMKEPNEGKGKGLSLIAYIGIGVVALGVVIYACVALAGTGTGDSKDGISATTGLHSGIPVADSEVSTKTAKVRDAHQRLHLKTIMTTPAIHWAQNYLIEQVAQWARAHPTKPGHDGMVKILSKEPAKYKAVVQEEVIKRLVQPSLCDAHNVCSENSVAEGIRNKVCPPGHPCPAQVLAQIHTTANWAAKIATDGAFHGLTQQMMHPPKAPLKNFGAQPHEAPEAAKKPPPPGGAWQSPGANNAW
mmetsp:Transcript_12417/g.19560  ORF Transcript_12417/g.19560 Transcript_12417/m.19560 type:complete len:267 (+) Transcript_12417:76-876(+)